MKFGYTVIWVDDVVKTVEFYEKAFGLVRRTLQATGKYIRGEIETGGTTLVFSSSREAEDVLPGGYHPNDLKHPPASIQITFITPDVATAYMRAIGAGAKPLDAPKNQPGGQTIARVRDPNGVLVALVNK
jgi:predicted enzyme related to lactoylglutathione lyase